MGQLAQSTVRWWPAIFRGLLYFFIAALPVLLSTLNDLVHGQLKVVPWLWSLTIGSAIYQGLVTVRAYTDNSLQRHKDELKENDRQEHDTEMFYAQKTAEAAAANQQEEKTKS